MFLRVSDFLIFKDLYLENNNEVKKITGNLLLHLNMLTITAKFHQLSKDFKDLVLFVFFFRLFRKLFLRKTKNDNS